MVTMNKFYLSSRIILLLILSTSISWAQFENVPPEAWNFRVLVLTAAQGHAHESMSDGVTLMDRLAGRHGFTLDHTTQGTDFTTTNLNQYDVIALNNSTKMQDILGSDNKTAFINYVENFSGLNGKSQGGVFGWHGATDMAAGEANAWPWYSDYLGGVYNGGEGGFSNIVHDITVEQSHPALLGVPDGFNVEEEWYFWHRPPQNQPGVVPVLWVEGGDVAQRRLTTWMVIDKKARSLFTGIGHAIELFTDSRIENHFAGSLLYASGYPESVTGCTDPLYVEFDSTAVINDPNQCVTLVNVGVELKMEGQSSYRRINSSNSKLIFEFKNGIKHHLIIIGADGKTYLDQDGLQMTEFDTSPYLNPGIYFVKIEANGKLLSRNRVVLY